MVKSLVVVNGTDTANGIEFGQELVYHSTWRLHLAYVSCLSCRGACCWSPTAAPMQHPCTSPAPHLLESQHYPVRPACVTQPCCSPMYVQAEAHGQVLGYTPEALNSGSAFTVDTRNTFKTDIGHFHVLPYGNNLFVAHTGANKASLVIRSTSGTRWVHCPTVRDGVCASLQVGPPVATRGATHLPALACRGRACCVMCKSGCSLRTRTLCAASVVSTLWLLGCVDSLHFLECCSCTCPLGPLLQDYIQVPELHMQRLPWLSHA